MSCQHVNNRGKDIGKECKNKANYGNFCKRHMKTKVRDLKTDEVFGTPASPEPTPKPTPDKPKSRFSVFRVTLNSQTDLDKMTSTEKQKFKALVEYVFDHENLPKYLIDRTNENPRINLRKIDSEYHFEVGTQYHRLHIHGFIKLEHCGNYMIARDKMGAIFEKY